MSNIGEVMSTANLAGLNVAVLALLVSKGCEHRLAKFFIRIPSAVAVYPETVDNICMLLNVPCAHQLSSVCLSH